MRYYFLGCAIMLLCGCDSNEWRDPDKQLEEEGIYCYSTLGSVDCYRRPIKRAVRTPVGYEGPPPPISTNE